MKSGSKEDKVLYCKSCLSIRIERLRGIDYCGKCGDVELGEVDVDEWERMWKKRYGSSYVDRRESDKEVKERLLRRVRHDSGSR